MPSNDHHEAHDYAESIRERLPRRMVVKIEGKLGYGYTAYAVADDTIFDLKGNTPDLEDDDPNATVFTVGERLKPPTHLRVVGGVKPEILEGGASTPRLDALD